ncbi:MAG: hypothetical protein PSV18_12265 [Methylobacter sp.]|nr:hypothetical protein [Candidatus Methylobacter titanis]
MKKIFNHDNHLNFSELVQVFNDAKITMVLLDTQNGLATLGGAKRQH